MNEIDEYLFVTGNKDKYLEAKKVFDRYNLKLIHVDISVDEIQSNSISEVLIWKGFEVSKILGDQKFIVEDTGLFIEALNGFPGVYSSYIFKTIGCEGILKLMEGVDNRAAYFLAYGMLYLGDGIFKMFKVKVDGHISREIRGSHGFGFDPIFIPDGSKHTYAEMSIDVKNRYSHRGKLFNIIAEYILNRGIVGEKIER